MYGIKFFFKHSSDCIKSSVYEYRTNSVVSISAEISSHNRMDVKHEESDEQRAARIRDQESMRNVENEDMIWPEIVDQVSTLGDDVVLLRSTPNTSIGQYDRREIVAINRRALSSPLPVDSLGRTQPSGSNSEIERVERTLLNIYAVQTGRNVSQADLHWPSVNRNNNTMN